MKLASARWRQDFYGSNKAYQLGNASDIYEALGFPAGGQSAENAAPTKLTVTPMKGAKEFNNLLDSIGKHIDLVEADAKAVDATAGEHEKMRVTTQAWADAQKSGLVVDKDRAASIEDLGERAKKAADALAEAKLKSDLVFEHAQLGRSDIEQGIFADLRGAGVSPNSDFGVMYAEQKQLNEQLKIGRDMSTDFATTFTSELRKGASAADALGSALDRVSGTLLDMVTKQLTQKAFGSMLGMFSSGGSSGGSGGSGDLASLNPFGVSAHGNAFVGGTVIPFAKGGVVRRPTLFPMARGMGLMGEAGPEAVVPLARLPSGDLGIKSAGSGAGDVNITVVSASGQNVGARETSRQRNASGGMDVTVMLEQVDAGLAQRIYGRARRHRKGAHRAVRHGQEIQLMPITWPAVLPQGVRVGSPAYQRNPAVERTDMESGFARTRLINRDPLARIKVEWPPFTAVQVQFFDGWLEHRARYGGAWFWISLPLDGAARSVLARFVGEVQRVPAGVSSWVVTAELEVRDPPVLTADVVELIELYGLTGVAEMDAALAAVAGLGAVYAIWSAL